MWLLTGRQLNTFIGQAEQKIPNKIEGVVLQERFLEKLKKTLHRFKKQQEIWFLTESTFRTSSYEPCQLRGLGFGDLSPPLFTS